MNESLIAFGGAVKALPDGRLGGNLITYGSPSERDVQGEYFTADTDYLIPPPILPTIYYHGWTKALGNKSIGRAELSRVESGFAVTTTLREDLDPRRRDDILRDAHDGKLGWSSGSANHLVNVSGDGRILQWPIVEASINPIRFTTDRRNRVLPMKAVRATAEGIEIDEDEAIAWPKTIPQLMTFLDRAKKAGRVLSGANWEMLSRLHADITACGAALGSFLQQTAPAPGAPDEFAFGPMMAGAGANDVYPAAKANPESTPPVPPSPPTPSTVEQRAAAHAALATFVRKLKGSPR